MFQRMFGRRKSPVPEESPTDTGIEAVEEKTGDIVNTDEFVVVDHTASETVMFDPPAGYTVGGANAFLPYGIDPRRPSESAYQRSLSTDVQTAIDGIPFKLGSKIMLEGSMKPLTAYSTEEMMSRINSFNWDDFEYNFELEHSIIKEFKSSEQNAT